MPTDLPVRCHCGALLGVAVGVSPRDGNHGVCYCDDCQLFARFLGRADTLLDAHGGTEIFQMSAGRLRITRGHEHLACMRLTRKGLLRWYAACCNTPVGNTLPGPAIPFLGLVLACAAPDATSGPLEACVGPRRVRVHGRYAIDAPGIGDPPVHDRVPLGNVARVLARLVAWRLRGDAARSPFFDRTTGEPVVRPHVLSAAEHKRLRAAAGS